MAEQQDFASCGWLSRPQQQVPDIRFVSEQWHCDPGFRAQLFPLTKDKLPGNPIEVNVNHTAQNNRAVRQFSD